MVQKSHLILGFVFLQIIYIASAANILYLCVVTSPSHHIWYVGKIYFNIHFRSVDMNHIFLFNRNSVYANGLAARGHNVTVVSADRHKNPPNDIHYIYMDGLYNELYYESVKDVFMPSQSTAFRRITEFTDRMIFVCKGDFNIANTDVKYMSNERLISQFGISVLSTHVNNV